MVLTESQEVKRLLGNLKQEILKKYEVESLLLVDVLEQEQPTYRQVSKGRPNKNTKYVKQVKKRFDISWSIDSVRLAEVESLDGIFPLITNVSDSRRGASEWGLRRDSIARTGRCVS